MGPEDNPADEHQPTEEDINAVARRLGFADDAEMFALILNLRIDGPWRLARFRKWQDEDGSKAGLLLVYVENGALRIKPESP